MQRVSGSRESAGTALLSWWRRCERMPFGAHLFRFILGFTVPYSTSVHPRVLTLAPGHVKVGMRDHRAVRNHLGSVHAIALANLGELASGLAMTAAMPARVRGIVRSISVEFSKKARGALVAECRVMFPEVTGDTDLEVRSEIRDEAGDLVSTVRVLWRLGLVPGAQSAASASASPGA